MRFKDIVSGYTFAGCPVVLDGTYADPGSYMDGGERLQITRNGRVEHIMATGGLTSLEVSEVLEALLSPIPMPTAVLHSDAPWLLGGLDSREIDDNYGFSFRVLGEVGIESNTLRLTVFPGGLSRQNVRIFKDSGKDPFSFRFLKRGANRFLTVRADGQDIIMKERELYPLAFLADDAATVKAVERLTGCALESDIREGGLYAVDVAALRREFVDSFDVFPSVIDLYLDGVKTARVSVEKSVINRESYSLKFRNSLGFYEVVEITGDMTVNRDLKAETYLMFDASVCGFVKRKQRTEGSLTFSIVTGCRSLRDVNLMTDMLASDEVYLLAGNLEIGVIPSIEEMQYGQRIWQPSAFSLSLECADTDRFLSADILSLEESAPGIFSKVFSKQFN